MLIVSAMACWASFRTALTLSIDAHSVGVGHVDLVRCAHRHGGLPEQVWFHRLVLQQGRWRRRRTGPVVAGGVWPDHDPLLLLPLLLCFRSCPYRGHVHGLPVCRNRLRYVVEPPHLSHDRTAIKSDSIHHRSFRQVPPGCSPRLPWDSSATSWDA